MASKRSAGTRVPSDYPPGLKITNRGLQGSVFEVTTDHPDAALRHEQVAAFVDSHPDGPPGGILILMMVINDQILDAKRLHAATSKQSCVYRDGQARFVEFECEGGWRDRREISNQTAAVVELNKGSSVTTEDWRWATKSLRSIHPLRSPFLTWQGFLSDAQSWWYPHCPGPIFDHAICMAPFQLLPRAALARLASGSAQCVKSTDTNENQDDGVALAQTTFGQTADTNIVEQLKIYVGQVARSKGAKATGRERILLRIQQQMPVAAQAGRAQVTVMGAIRHAIVAGGVRGEPWAPITVYEYLRQGISQLVVTLIKEELDSLNGEKFYEIYAALLQEIKLSQRAKFEAFLLAFHRYLLICGFDHLPRALSGKKELVPPVAGVIWKHELELALSYVETVAPTPRVALQAKLGLVFGYWIPMRTVELWCIRMSDVHISNPMFIAVYTRQRDGVGKVKSLRRQEDVTDTQLKQLLLDMVELRQNEDDADDEDFLLGQPQQPGERHEQVLTAKLMNDALKWATGDAAASYYDLRHSVFSARARKVLEEAAHGRDTFGWYQMAAQGGHAGPASSASYIHQIEHALALVSQNARPQAWLPAHLAGVAMSAFPDIATGLQGARPPMPPRITTSPFVQSSSELGVQTREAIVWRVADGFKLHSIASEFNVGVEVVEMVTEEMLQAMVQMRLVKQEVMVSIRKQCMAITAYALWARSAKQEKFAFFAKHLEADVRQKNFKALLQLWHDWSLCRDGEFLALVNSRPAARIVNLLLQIGATRKSLAVTSMQEAAPLAIQLKQIGIPAGPICKRRSKRPGHRLVLTSRGVDASKASGASISMMGFHWWMLLVGSFLISVEEI